MPEGGSPEGARGGGNPGKWGGLGRRDGEVSGIGGVRSGGGAHKAGVSGVGSLLGVLGNVRGFEGLEMGGGSVLRGSRGFANMGGGLKGLAVGWWGG